MDPKQNEDAIRSTLSYLTDDEYQELLSLASDDTNDNVVSEEEYLDRTAKWRPQPGNKE